MRKFSHLAQVEQFAHVDPESNCNSGDNDRRIADTAFNAANVAPIKSAIASGIREGAA